jgi:hypothetical protein
MLIKNIEKKIWDIEGFAIRINEFIMKHHSFALYPFEKMALNRLTVAEWCAQRFHVIYPNYTVEVLDADGDEVIKNVTLGFVRDTYLD